MSSSIADMQRANLIASLNLTEQQAAVLSISDLQTLYNNAGSTAIMVGGGGKIFVQADDPAETTTVSDGDIWYEIP